MNISLAGDEYLKQTVERYSDMLIRIAYHNTGNYGEAEDIAQEVFIRMLAQDSFNDEEHLKAWLLRVAINLCRDYTRSGKHKTSERYIDETQSGEAVFEIRDGGILSEIMKLKKDYRNAIFLYYYEDYTLEQAAKIMNINPNTFSSLLRRAKKKLKADLLEGGYEYE